MFKSIAFKILSSFSKPIVDKDIEAREEEECLKQAQISLSQKKERDVEYYKEWVKPENIEARKRLQVEQALEALENGVALRKKIREAQGLPYDDPPLPDPIPEHMQGQAESTIRRMLAHESWTFNELKMGWLNDRGSILKVKEMPSSYISLITNKLPEHLGDVQDIVESIQNGKLRNQYSVFATNHKEEKKDGNI
jgi:hypothetical protein